VTNTSESIDARTTLAAVELRVADLDRVQAFYEHVLGLRAVERDGDVVRLGAESDRPLVELHGVPGATPRPRRATGLFHLAILVPSRPELARALNRVVDMGASLTGASDHLVSEALYLDDPEGNGIEIYRDRRREEWTYEDGVLRMATLPLDVDGVMSEMPAGEDPGMAPGTRIGHVHLQVSDVAETDAFYSGLLGFDVTVRTYPGALFMSAGGYHHHIGANTWNSAGAPAPGAESRGLRRFEVVVPDAAELERIERRFEAAGLPVQHDGDALLLADPSGNRVLVRAPMAPV
jgi:catechol 2,3-dioxygenase